MLTGWLREKKQQKQWEKVVDHLKPEEMEKVHAMLKKEKAPPSGVGDSLKSYTKWYMSEKKTRADFLRKLPVSSATLLKTKDQLHAMILRGGNPLSAKEIDRICKDEKSFAEYLTLLSIEQLETLKQALRDNVVKMDPPVKQTFLKLLTMVQEERFAFEKERIEKLGPAVSQLQIAIALRQRIAKLEQIQKELSSTPA